MTLESRSDKMVIYLNSDCMGRGDDDLGRGLLDTFLGTLADFVPQVSHILLVNAGVKLICEGSPALENMGMLEGGGVRILACGTCLAHYNLKEKVKVGSVSNMFSILEVLSDAEKVLTP